MMKKSFLLISMIIVISIISINNWFLYKNVQKTPQIINSAFKTHENKIINLRNIESAYTIIVILPEICSECFIEKDYLDQLSEKYNNEALKIVVFTNEVASREKLINFSLQTNWPIIINKKIVRFYSRTVLGVKLLLNNDKSKIVYQNDITKKPFLIKREYKILKNIIDNKL